MTAHFPQSTLNPHVLWRKMIPRVFQSAGGGMLASACSCRIRVLMAFEDCPVHRKSVWLILKIPTPVHEFHFFTWTATLLVCLGSVTLVLIKSVSFFIKWVRMFCCYMSSLPSRCLPMFLLYERLLIMLSFSHALLVQVRTRAGDVAQLVKWLPKIHEALGSILALICSISSMRHSKVCQ